jgi:RNA polymerase sigma-70 factor, ECF subfamily
MPDFVRLQGNPGGRLGRMLSVEVSRMPSSAPGPEPGSLQRSNPAPDLDATLTRVARGDQAAFELLYDRMAGPVYGLIRKVLRDPAQSEEVAQEVLLEVWRTAARFDAKRGRAASWVLTIAHRRAVDRVRSESAAAEREQRSAAIPDPAPGDEVAETVEASLEAERVRRCLDGLTDLQREAVTLAFYKGYSYPQVAALLDVALGTIKTRIRDGLIRMRDCLGVAWLGCCRAGARRCTRWPGPMPLTRSMTTSGTALSGTCPAAGPAPRRSAASPPP